MIKVKIKGNILEEFEESIKKAKKKTMEKAVIALKEATPVDTGEARDGWKLKKDAIVNDVEYIDYLNHGSSKQAPSHFIEKTLLAQKGLKPNGTIVR